MKNAIDSVANGSPMAKEEGAFRWWPVLLAMSLPFVSSLFYFVLFSEAAWAQVLYSMTKVFQVVWPVLALRWILKGRFRWPALWPPGSWRAFSLGVASGLVIVVLLAVAWWTPFRDVVIGSADKIRDKVEPLGVLNWYWTFGLFLAVVHSFLEEYYWRWFVFGRLRQRLPVWRAHVLAGAAFASHHIIITTQYFPLGWGIVFGSMVGLGGVLWSVLYVRQKTLAGAWISHVMVDLGILSFGHKILFGTWI